MSVCLCLDVCVCVVHRGWQCQQNPSQSYARLDTQWWWLMSPLHCLSLLLSPLSLLVTLHFPSSLRGPCPSFTFTLLPSVLLVLPFLRPPRWFFSSLCLPVLLCLSLSFLCSCVSYHFPLWTICLFSFPFSLSPRSSRVHTPTPLRFALGQSLTAAPSAT